MPTLKYPKNPNIETAFVEQDDGTKNRVVMTAPQDISTLEYPSNPNSTKGYVTVDGKKQRVIMVADIVGGGGGGAVTSVNGQTGDVVLSIPDAVQYSTMPTPASTNEGDIVQFTGTTDANYTNGYFYKCAETTTPSSATATQTVGSSLSDIAVVVATFETQVSSSGTYVYTYTNSNWENAGEIVDFTDYGITYTGTPVEGDQIDVVYTEASTSYAWTRIDVQPAPEALPDQTGQSGKFLTTDGTDASWSDKPLVNKATGSGSMYVSTSSGQNQEAYSTLFGTGNNAGGMRATAYGYGCVASEGGIAIGTESYANGSGAIQLGKGTNSTNGTFCVSLSTTGYNNWNNYELLSADGTIPTARLTKVNSTITLTAAGWSSNTQTVTISGMTATGVVFVSPDPTDQADYTTAGIICTSQATNSLTFSCSTTPTSDIDVVVVML